MSKGLQSYIGEYVIVRTCHAGVHYGKLIEKEGDEVILHGARRLYYWKTNNGGISLSEVATSGLHPDSKICERINIWLLAIEIIPCSKEAQKSIENHDDYIDA